MHRRLTIFLGSISGLVVALLSFAGVFHPTVTGKTSSDPLWQSTPWEMYGRKQPAGKNGQPVKPGSTVRLCACSQHTEETQRGEQDHAPRFALLVGATRYYHKSSHPFNDLEGPGNDVLLMQQTLIDEFGFSESNIVILSETAGGENTPTREHIRREFANLAQRARIAGPETRIVILLAGHGSQQPDRDQDMLVDPEPDGRDELFLPADIGAWDEERQTVTNAIVDDELRQWVGAITETGAFVWVIVDSCHSGTLMRGGNPVEVSRHVSPADLGIPANAFSGNRGSENASAGSRGGSPGLTPVDQPGMVAIYAAQPFELAPERRPYRSDDPNKYGLLTWTICSTIRQSPNLTYRELVSAVNRRYLQWGRRNGPTPLVEGGAQDQLILDGRERQPGFTLQQSPTDRTWQINGGRLHGLTTGTILAVYPPPGQGESGDVIAHVRIDNLDSFSAGVTPCAWNDVPKPDAGVLQVGARCEIRFTNYGEMQMPVAVADNVVSNGAFVPPDDDQAVQLARIRKSLKKCESGTSAVFRLVDDPEVAEWIVQFREDDLILLPADVASIASPLPDQVPAFLIRTTPAGAADELVRALTNISRARNLIAIESTGPPGRSAGTGSDRYDNFGQVQVDVRMLLLADRFDRKGTPLEWQRRDVELEHGQWVTWELTNRGNETVDVTLLFIDSHYGIEPLFPRPNRASDNRLLPGRSLRLPPARINASTSAGLEQLVLIAVAAKGPPVDFSILAQPSLDLATNRSSDDTGALATPLGKFLKTACYGSGGTRGMDSPDMEDYQVKTIPWRVLPLPDRSTGD